MLLLFILLGALLVPFTWINRLKPAWIALIYPVVGLILSGYALLSHHTLSFKASWIPALDLNLSFRLDSLSLIFFTLIAFIGCLVIIYSFFYLSTDENLSRFYSFILLFMIAMYGVVLSNNTFLLYIFWELTSISSFLLISFWYNKEKSSAGALKSFLITVLGGMMMLLGFIALYVLTGTNELNEIIPLLSKINEGPLYTFAICMILMGALTKSAQFPFHIWLPDAMEAPTPVSAYLHSATMVKAGIYLLLRFLPAFSGDPLFQWILIVDGLLTMFIGSFFAVRQSDMKGLLAYSTISHLGMIVSLIGIASFPASNGNQPLIVLALTAALLHIMNHAIFKAALFMGAGIVDHAASTRDLNQLGGLRRALPMTFVFMTICALSMAGIPLLNGFLSKEMFLTVFADYFEGNGRWGLLLLCTAVIASIGTFLYSFVLIGRTFLGEKHLNDIEKESAGILSTPVFLTLLVIMMFFIPNILLTVWLRPAMEVILPHNAMQLIEPIHAWHGINLPFVLTIIIILSGSILYISGLYRKIFPKRKEMWLNIVYRETLVLMDRFSSKVIKRIMTDRLNHYLMILYGVVLMIMIPITLMLIPGNHRFTGLHVTEFPIYEATILLLISIASIALLRTTSRMTAVILTGAIGYGISTIYILLKAPDLALTQLVIETITTVLFLSSFYHLPKIVEEQKGDLNKIVSFFIAAGVSILIMILMLVAGNLSIYPSISVYYEKAYELTGGKNIVNAILGDFRAFDTLLEGVVLMITGLGIYALIHQPKRSGKNERK